MSDRWRGHEINEKRDGVWVYADGTEVCRDSNRPCGHCGRRNTPDGHDGCLGTLPGVVNACCGHGRAGEAYAVLATGERLTGERFNMLAKEGR